MPISKASSVVARPLPALQITDNNLIRQCNCKFRIDTSGDRANTWVRPYGMGISVLSWYFFDPRCKNGKPFWICYICIYCVEYALWICSYCVASEDREIRLNSRCILKQQLIGWRKNTGARTWKMDRALLWLSVQFCVCKAAQGGGGGRSGAGYVLFGTAGARYFSAKCFWKDLAYLHSQT